LQGGGAERVVLTVLRHLDRTQFDLALAVVDCRQPTYANDIPGNVELIDLESRRVRNSLLGILRLIWRRRPDVVFSTIGHLNLGMALIKPFFPRRTRLVLRETIVVTASLSHTTFRRAWSLGYRFLYRLCDRIVCQSEDMRRDLVRNFSMPPDMITLIRNPVDVPRVTALSESADVPTDEDASTIRLVAAGRLEHQKGFDLLIEALAMCTDVPFRLDILGEGSLRRELSELANARGIGSRVHFLGFQRNPYSFFRAADAFVLSSRFEGLPNVVLEALVCGTSVIAVPAPGGIEELLRGRPGCSIADDVSAKSLAAAIAAFPFRRSRPIPPTAEFDAPAIASQYSALFLSADT
jgi:glycosyltransferase involved in cell wall biosynthesis